MGCIVDCFLVGTILGFLFLVDADDLFNSDGFAILSGKDIAYITVFLLYTVQLLEWLWRCATC
jgi:hypothetical protein